MSCKMALACVLDSHGLSVTQVNTYIRFLYKKVEKAFFFRKNKAAKTFFRLKKGANTFFGQFFPQIPA